VRDEEPESVRLFFLDGVEKNLFKRGAKMKYPNLNWMIWCKGERRYQIAVALKISEATLTRKFQGRADFLPYEKERIAEILGYTSSWLFAELTPPASARRPAMAQATA